jgi:hypothetical protein
MNQYEVISARARIAGTTYVHRVSVLAVKPAR